MPPIDGQDAADVAREHFSRKYDLESVNATEGPTDLTNPRTGSGYQVKAAVDTLSTGGNGRFTIWNTQVDPEVNVWFGFAVYDRDMNVLEAERIKTEVVAEIIESRGGYNTVRVDSKTGNLRKRVAWPVIIEGKYKDEL